MERSVLSPPLPLRRVFRRPDTWVVCATTLIVCAIVAARTDLSFTSFDRLAFNRLADSFGVGILGASIVVFAGHLLRSIPVLPRRALGVAGIGLVAALTFVLLHTYAWTDHRRTNWLLQGFILALLGVVGLLALLLPATGLARWRAVGAAAADVARNWCLIYFYLLMGGYSLAAVRLDRPVVLDPILWRMDFSLGFSPTEVVAACVAAHPWFDPVTHYGYPLLGLLIGGVAASLHLAGDVAAMRRSLLAFLLIAVLGNACYWCAPAIGPGYAFPELFTEAALAGDAGQRDALRQAVIEGPDRFDRRRDLLRNVMPSLHTTFALTLLAAAWNHRRRLFCWWLPLGAMQIVTTLTLNVHYLVDLFAAVPLSILCWWLADLAVRRVPPTGAVPLPDLVAPPAQRRRLGAMLAGALALAVLVLVGWGKYAPISPWLAWPAVGLVAALPAWLARRLFKPAAFGWQTRAARDAGPTLAPPVGAAAPPARLLAGAVFCTGGTALVLEQVAEKYLSTLLGSSRPAATIVLAVYFTGLALGALLCPRGAVGAPRRLAWLEIFIGVWAAVLAFGFFATDRALGTWLADTGTSAGSLTVARVFLAALWLLPPTLAMGAQLPTLAAVLGGHPALRGESLPRYYALNLAGAFVFTLLAPPLLFNTVGANATLWFVSLLAILVGTILWSGLPAGSNATAAQPSHSQSLSLSLPPLLWAFAAGFAFFALEVVWFHLISAVCGASTYSFSILLAAVLLGLALAGRHAARRPGLAPAATLGWLVLALALGNALWPWAGRLLAAVAGLLRLEWFWAGELLKLGVVSLLVVPPAFALGRIFPLLLGAPGADSRHVARLSVANILGCVAGALATGFFLIPGFGAERTLLGLALLAAAGWIAQRPAWRFRQLAPAGVGLILLVALPRWDRLELTRGLGVYLSGGLPADAQLVSFAEDFHAGFVTVATTPRSGGGVTKTLLQNGKFDADDAGEVPAQAGFGLVGALHAPALDRALVIGAGSGHTAAVISRLGFARLDLAELSPAHLAAARAHFGHLHGGVFDRPGVTVHLEDGRQHLLRTRARYDLIQIEISSVWFAGATNLYSREFYALARARLAPGGVLVQWVQLHHLTPREIATMLATARAEFARVSVWRVGHQACLLASAEAQRFNPAVVERWRNSPALAPERRATRADSPAEFAVELLVTPSQLDGELSRYRATVGINTDRNRWLEFRTPQHYLSRFDHRAANLRWLAGIGSPPGDSP